MCIRDRSGIGLKDILAALLRHIKDAKAEDPGVVAASAAVCAAKRGQEGFFRRRKEALDPGAEFDDGYWGPDGEWIWYEDDEDDEDAAVVGDGGDDSLDEESERLDEEEVDEDDGDDDDTPDGQPGR